MNYGKLFKSLASLGYTPCVEASYYNLIANWNEWYTGYCKKFHEVSGTNGLVATKRKMESLNMAKKVAEDWASSLLNEKAEIVVNSGTRNKVDKSSVFVQGSDGEGGVLGSNDFFVSMNELIERSFALGTGAVVLSLDDVLVGDSGNIYTDSQSTIGMSFLDAFNIVPLSVSNRRVIDCAFVSEEKSGRDSTYTISVHTKGDNGYVITKYKLDDKYRKVGEPEVLNTRSKAPLFYLVKPAIVNNKAKTSTNPMGVSIFADAIGCLQNVDMAFDDYNVELDNGKMKLFVDQSLLPRDSNNNPIPPRSDGNCLYQVTGDGEGIQSEEYMKEFAPQLRIESLHTALQDALNALSFKVGLGNHYYNFEPSGGVTATEYVGTQNDFIRNCKKHSNSLSRVIASVVSEILFLGKEVFKANVNESSKVTVQCADGFIEDDTTKKNEDRKDVEMGIMSKAEYRAKWYGETLENAQIIVDKIKEDNAEVVPESPDDNGGNKEEDIIEE